MGMNKKQSSLDSEKLVIKESQTFQSQTFQTNFMALNCRTASFQGLEEERNGKNGKEPLLRAGRQVFLYVICGGVHLKQLLDNTLDMALQKLRG